MNLNAEYMANASMLPILDAAAYLWLNRREVESSENINLREVHEHFTPTDVHTEGRLLEEGMLQQRLERNAATERQLKHWLEISHPNSSENEIVAAIEAVIKLENDINKCCSRAYDNFNGDTDKIRKKIFQDNDSFGEKTRNIVSYKVAHRMYK